MTLELEKLTDEELNEVRAKALDLLNRRDTERKDKALAEARKIREKAEADARALLASVGLGPKAATSRKRRAAVHKGSGKATTKEAAPNTVRKAG